LASEALIKTIGLADADECPSALKLEPVTRRAAGGAIQTRAGHLGVSSEAKESSKAATSLGWPSRPNGLPPAASPARGRSAFSGVDLAGRPGCAGGPSLAP